MNPSTALIALFTSLLLLSPAIADEVRLFPDGLDKSHWASGDESETEIWLVKRADGSMELRGRDVASTYGGLVIHGAESGDFICHGRGFRFIGGLAFTYRSTLSANEVEGGIILSEKWTATLTTGETIKGETVFSPVSEEIE